MSIRLPVSYKPFITKDFASWDEVFNPTINTGWKSHSKLKLNHFIQIITTLYSRDNILANLDAHFFHVIDDYGPVDGKTLATRFLDIIPDEQLYLLFYLSEIHISRDSWAVSGAKLTRDVGNETTFYAEVTGTDCNAYFNADGNRKFRDFLTKRHNEVQLLWEGKKDRTYSHHNWQGARLCRTLIQFYGGMSVFAMPDGDSANAERLHNAMRLNDALKLTVNRQGTNFKFTVKEKVTLQNRQPLYKTLPYSTNILDLLDYPITLENEHNPILYGVELEIATNYTERQLVDAAEVPFFALKSDASVTGNKNFKYEIVTVPMSFKAHRRQWAKFFSSLDYAQFDTTTKTNNGMHVHIERAKFFNQSHIRNFCWFVNNPANRSFMMALSERDPASYEKYSKNFDIPFGSSKGRTIRDAANLAATVRGATNIHKKGVTVEVRLFKGIVSFANVIKNLEVVDSFFDYTSNVALQDLNLKGYIHWLNHQPYNKYKVLRKFIHDMDLATMTVVSELEDMIFTERDPARIVQILHMKSVPLTEEHARQLNILSKRRSFAFNPHFQRIELAAVNRPIADLNSDLQNRYRA